MYYPTYNVCATAKYILVIKRVEGDYLVSLVRPSGVIQDIIIFCHLPRPCDIRVLYAAIDDERTDESVIFYALKITKVRY